MVFIDAHCHIDRVENIPKLIENAKKNNVKIIINNGLNKKTNRLTLKLSEKYPEIKSALGIYPTHCLEMTSKELEKEFKFIRKNKNKIIAIGEVGLDLKEIKEIEKQRKIFEKFIKLSIELDKPIIVHSRKAEKEAIESLEKLNAKKVIMHCFSGKKKLIERIKNNNWTLTIPTNVKHSQQFQDMIQNVPIEQLLCETDSPYLHPDKKFPNEPTNIIESYKKIAEIKKLSIKEIEKQLEKNFKKLFN